MLKQNLKQLKSANAALRAVVNADDASDYQSMVSILDLLRQLDGRTAHCAILVNRRRGLRFAIIVFIFLKRLYRN